MAPTSNEVQAILNSETLPNALEEAIPSDTAGTDLPPQEVSDEKPKKRTRKKVEEEKIDPDLDNFIETTKRLSLQTVFDRMAKSEQKTVVVKEIKIEEAFDFKASIETLRKTFDTELAKKITELNAIYKTEVQKIKDKVAFKNIALMLSETISLMKSMGWTFNTWHGINVVSKYFTPHVPLTKCFSSEGWINWKEPFALLKALHLGYTDPKVSSSNIFVEVQGVHPNASTNGNRAACAGTLGGRTIDILDAKKFGVLLDEIERQYKFGNLLSAYNGMSTANKSKYVVLQNVKEIEESKWC